MKTVTRTILIADDGMILTDGNSYGKTVYLAEGADASEWREVPENEINEADGGEVF